MTPAANISWPSRASPAGFCSPRSWATIRATRAAADYSRWADQGFGIIARLNNGYEPNGTIPLSSRYADFAQRCANFVRNSRGCHIWIIGNEMNFAVERPGVQFNRKSESRRAWSSRARSSCRACTPTATANAARPSRGWPATRTTR